MAIFPFTAADERVFLGMLAGCLEIDWERREYAVVLARLEEGPEASSSELVSNAARFLPLGSLSGSLMVKAAGVEAAPRRVRLDWRKDSSDVSFSLEFSVDSFVRLALVVARVVLVEVDSVAGRADDDSAEPVSRSFAFPLSLDLFFAALVRALERSERGSVAGNESKSSGR